MIFYLSVGNVETVQFTEAQSTSLDTWTGYGTPQLTRQWWYNYSQTSKKTGTNWARDASFETEDWGESSGGQGIKYGGRQQNIVHQGSWSANYSIQVSAQSGWVSCIGMIRPNPAYFAIRPDVSKTLTYEPTGDNLTFWWYVNELSANEGIAYVTMQIEKFVEPTQIGGSWTIVPSVNLYVILAQGKTTSDDYSNSSTDCWIRAPTNYNVTGQWNKCSLPIWSIVHDYKGEYPVWFNYLSLFVRVFDADTGDVEVLFDDVSLETGPRQASSADATAYYIVKDGEENATWIITLPTPGYHGSAWGQHWAITWPKGHDIINITIPDTTIIEKPIVALSDDAMIYGTSWSTASTYNVFMIHYGNEHREIGLKFNDITIPQGTIIAEVHLIGNMEIGFTTATTETVRFRCLDEANTATFSTKGNFLARPRTDAYIDYCLWRGYPIYMWDWVWIHHNFWEMVQEVINRSDWVSGNALGFASYCEGSDWDEWTWWSRNAGAGVCPIVWIKYVTPIVASFNETVSYNGTHYEGRMYIDVAGQYDSGPVKLYTRSPNIMYDIVVTQNSIEEPVTIQTDDSFTVSLRVRNGTSGSFLQDSTVYLDIYDNSNSTVKYSTSGETDSNGWLNQTVPANTLTAGTYFIRGRATYGSVNYVGLKVERLNAETPPVPPPKTVVPPPPPPPPIITPGTYNIIVQVKDQYDLPLEGVHVKIRQELTGSIILGGYTDAYGQFIGKDLAPNQYYMVKTYFYEQDQSQTVYLDDQEERLNFEFRENILSVAVTVGKIITVRVAAFSGYVTDSLITPPLTIPDMLVWAIIATMLIGIIYKVRR